MQRAVGLPVRPLASGYVKRLQQVSRSKHSFESRLQIFGMWNWNLKLPSQVRPQWHLLAQQWRYSICTDVSAAFLCVYEVSWHQAKGFSPQTVKNISIMRAFLKKIAKKKKAKCSVKMRQELIKIKVKGKGGQEKKRVVAKIARCSKSNRNLLLIGNGQFQLVCPQSACSLVMRKYVSVFVFLLLLVLGNGFHVSTTTRCWQQNSFL